MGDFNPNTPNLRGMEWRPSSARLWRGDSPLRALVQRFRPGAVTPVNDHNYLETVVGNPGLAVEYVDTLAPTLTDTDYYPGTDTGAVVTGWQDQGAGTANYTEIDDAYDLTDYHRNTSALSAAATLDLLFRGSVSALSGVRIVSVALQASLKLTTASGNGDSVRVHGLLDLGGTRYAGGGAVDVRKTGRFAIYELSKWRLNPSTDLPWTVAQVNALLQSGGAATDEFGIRLSKGRVAAQGFLVSGMWLRVTTCTENRYGFHYLASPPRVGWTELALTSPAAFTANTWYYRVVYPLVGNAEAYFDVPVLKGSTAVEAASGSGTGEHREVSTATMSGPGGVAVSSSERPGEMVPVLFDTGSIISQSNPYADLIDDTYYTGATANRGQEITCAAGTAYAAVRLPVGWQDINRRPDQPLVVELRTGGGMLTGGGTLQATATLDPATVTAGGIVDTVIPFTAFTPGATQVFALIKSSATSGRGWIVPRLDTRSDRIGSATTVNEIEQASFGPSTGTGQTDSYSSGGTEADRYDIPVALIAAPTAPAGLTATAAAATTTTPPYVAVSWTATALGSSFGAYRVYRRPSRAVAQPWVMVAELGVPDSYTAATVEAQHIAWRDYMAGWAVTGGQWADGWDYTVTVVSAATGLESAKATADTRNTVTPAEVGWLVSNDAPWLNTPGVAVLEPRSKLDYSKIVRRAVGRDLAVVSTPLELPPKVLTGRWEMFDRVGEDQARRLFAAAASGRVICMHRILGDRIIGDLDIDEVRERPAGAGESIPITVTETTRTGDVAGVNLDAGVVLNGSSQYAWSPAASDLNPAAGGFTIFLAGVFPNAASKVLVANGIPGGGAGAALASGGTNIVALSIQGASTTVNAVATDAATFSGDRVLVGTHNGAASQKIYRDGTALTVSSTDTPGSLAAIATGLAFGAIDLGGSGTSFAALAPGRAWGWYGRELTAAEVLDLSYYLKGYPGYRPPAGPVAFFDLRDLRCWPGFGTTIADLSGNGHTAALVASPATRGVPWPLGDLERF